MNAGSRSKNRKREKEMIKQENDVAAIATDGDIILFSDCNDVCVSSAGSDSE